jgi:rubrerythrin
MKDGLNEIKDIGDLTSVREILEMAIKKEESAHLFYMIAHDRACNKVEKDLFLQLAQEELVHKQNLQRQLEEIKARMFTDQALSSGEVSGPE